MILKLLLITTIICFIIDCSGFVNSIKRQYLRKFMKMQNPDASLLNWKPFDCSMCVTFWTGIIFLLSTSQFTLLNLCIVCMFAFLASNISGLMMTIKDYISVFENWLQKLIS